MEGLTVRTKFSGYKPNSEYPDMPIRGTVYQLQSYEGSNSQWIVRSGEIVRVDVYFESSMPIGELALAFMFDNRVLENAWDLYHNGREHAKSQVLFNDDVFESVVTLDNADGVFSGLVDAGLYPAHYFDDYGGFYIQLGFNTGKNPTVFVDPWDGIFDPSISSWAFCHYLRVKDPSALQSFLSDPNNFYVGVGIVPMSTKTSRYTGSVNLLQVGNVSNYNLSGPKSSDMYDIRVNNNFADGNLTAGNLYYYSDWLRLEGGIYKLMPKNQSSTVMIERVLKNGNKVVETYNTGISNAVNATVSSVVTAFYNTYGQYESFAYSDDDNNGVNNKVNGYSRWFLYGLPEGTTINQLGDYITVSRNGFYRVFKNGTQYALDSTASVGTGTIIKVYTNRGVFVEQFVVVIYGDIDGNGSVNKYDTEILLNETGSRTWSALSSSTRDEAKVRAADLDGNGSFNKYDYEWKLNEDGGTVGINQITGRAFIKST